jgi:hypothetical protein
MKIYVSHSKEIDYVNELYKPIRDSDLNSRHEFFLPHESERPTNTKEIIKNSSLILAETSFPATGQGIELGWAEMFRVPILCVYKEGSEISGSLKYITKNFISYTDEKDLIIKLQNYLQ